MKQFTFKRVAVRGRLSCLGSEALYGMVSPCFTGLSSKEKIMPEFAFHESTVCLFVLCLIFFASKPHLPGNWMLVSAASAPFVFVPPSLRWASASRTRRSRAPALRPVWAVERCMSCHCCWVGPLCLGLHDVQKMPILGMMYDDVNSQQKQKMVHILLRFTREAAGNSEKT